MAEVEKTVAGLPRGFGGDQENDTRHEQIAEIFAQSYQALKWSLRSRLHSEEDAEEHLQEAFLKLCQVDDLDQIRRPGSFLFVIAKNLATDTLRRRALKVIDSNIYVDTAEIEHRYPSVESQVSTRQDLKRLWEAILSLSPCCRRVFIFKKIYGYSYNEIAVELGISVKTVENHLAIGLVKCDKFLMSTYGVDTRSLCCAPVP